MRKPLKLLLVAGARPNFMKVAPIIRAIHRHNELLDSGTRSSAEIESDRARPIHYRLIHTGQHYDSRMSDVFFRELGIPAPDFNLEAGSGSHAIQTANIMQRFEPVLLKCFAVGTGDNGSGDASTSGSGDSPLPDWLVVVGDVNSTMACTIVASKLGVKVAHVEAGLRSFDRTMPEEINRLVTDALADMLLTPSEDASENLRREGVPAEKVKLVGNIMIDALMENLDVARQSKILASLGVKPKNFAYVTLHRPSNVDDRDSLAAITTELTQLAAYMPVVFPMHPRTRKRLAEFGLGSGVAPGLKVIDPVGYHESLHLTEQARLVLTDSGGLQEESTFFRTPCLTLRPNTERPVTISIGSNRLTSLPQLPSDLKRIMSDGEKIGHVPPLWDGSTATRIVAALLDSAA